MRKLIFEKKSWAVMTAIMVFIIAVIVFLFLSRPRLEIYNSQTGEMYCRLNAYEGMEFSIEFIHSVNNSPVCDIFIIKENVIHAKATKYSDFGAGVQSELEPGQSMVFDENGDMIISGFTFKYDKLLYIVGTVSDHVLTIEGEQISLRELCGKNAQIAFEIR